MRLAIKCVQVQANVRQGHEFGCCSAVSNDSWYLDVALVEVTIVLNLTGPSGRPIRRGTISTDSTGN